MVKMPTIIGILTFISMLNVIYPSLVLVQPRKTSPCLTERLLMGRKESNQTNKSMLNATSECLKARKVGIFQQFSFYEQLKFHAQLI